MFGLVLVSGWGLDRLRPWTRTSIRFRHRGRRSIRAGWRGWRRSCRSWPPRICTACRMPPWPPRCWSSGGCWTAWKDAGSSSSRPSMPTWPPGPTRCWWRRPGGWIHPGCATSWTICFWSPTSTVPRRLPSGVISGGGMAGPDLGRHGRHRRTPGGRGRPHPAGGPGAPGPPRRRQRPPQRRAAHRRRPHRAGPPGLGGRPAAKGRRGPAPADGDRGPGQPARPPRWGGWRGGLGGGRWSRRRAGGWPATGRDPGPGRPRVAPGSWSPAGPAATATPITAPATRNTERPATYGESATHGERRGWRRGCGLRPPSCRRCWVGRPASPSTSGGAAGSSSPTAQRSALTVRDRGCVFPDCARPLSWCDAHHLCHWLDGGPTDLSNLALVCRAHHRAVHEGGWQLIRGPDGAFAATPSQRTQRPHPRHPSAAEPPAGAADPPPPTAPVPAWPRTTRHPTIVPGDCIGPEHPLVRRARRAHQVDASDLPRQLPRGWPWPS
jgi:hypothetical protein